MWQADVATRPAGGWTDLGGLVLHATGLPFRHWNGAYLTAPEGLARLREAADWFADRGLPWGVLVPAELGLEVPGMSLVADHPVMLRPLEALPSLPPADLRWGQAAAAALVQSSAFGDAYNTELAFLEPKARNGACALVTLYDGSDPVSTATLVVTDGTAAVFGVATEPGHRRRGLGRVVTLAVLHEAVARGCDLAYLNPTASGYPLYAGLGFLDAPPWRIWASG